MTYDDLIERLHTSGAPSYDDGRGGNGLMREAAQAIRDLQAQNAKLREALEWYRHRVNEFSTATDQSADDAEDILDRDAGNTAATALEDTP